MKSSSNFEFSDSSNSSTEENPPNLELEYEENQVEEELGNGNNIISNNTKCFSVKTLHYSPSAPVQDLHQQISQPISW